MLKLPHKYTDDKKADALIASYLNWNILELVMEYVMYSLIQMRLENADRLGMRTQELERIEDLHYYENTYFWDFDFMLLDSFSEEELLASPVSEFLEI